MAVIPHVTGDNAEAQSGEVACLGGDSRRGRLRGLCGCPGQSEGPIFQMGSRGSEWQRDLPRIPE